MAEFILEKGRDYSLIKIFDPRYALRLEDLSCRRFGSLEEIFNEAEKKGIINGKFYVFKPKDSKNMSVFYFFSRSGISKESAIIKHLD